MDPAKLTAVGDELEWGTPSGDDARDAPRNAVESSDDGQTAVLYLRGSPVNREHENEVIRALNTLAADGHLHGVVVKTWPEKVSYQHDRGTRSLVIDVFESLDEWAREHDLSICPPFIRREHDSAITDERDEVLHTPMMFLTVVDRNGIAGLYPCDHGDAVTTIEDWLARFDEVDAGGPATPKRPPEPDLAPERGNR